MARTYVVTSAPNAAELVESFDLAVAALLSHRLTRLDLLATNEQRRNGTEYRAVLTYDTGATVLTTPFQLAVFEGRSPAEAQSKLAAFAAANPTAFISEALGVVFGGQQRTVGDALAVVYNASAGAGDNWGAGGAGADGVRYFEYLNGNSVASNVITESRGVDISAALLKGFVCENARTNLETNTTVWSVTAGTCAFQAVNPDRMGRQSALFTEDTSTSFHFAYQGSSSRTVGNSYTYSVYVKAGTCSKVQLTSGVAVVGADAYVNFDLVALTITAQGAAAERPFIEDVGDGWRRIGFTSVAILTTSAANVLVATLQTGLETRLPSFAGTSRTFYRAMAQTEAGGLPAHSFASTFIPTLLGSATRADDLCSYTMDYTRLSRDYAVTIGFFIDLVVPLADRRTLSFTDNTLTRFQVVAHNNSATPQTGFFFGDGTNVNFHFAGLTVIGQGYIGCSVRRKANNPLVTSSVGESRYSGGGPGADTVPTRLTIGASGGATFGPVRHLRLWASAQRDDVVRMWAKNS